MQAITEQPNRDIFGHDRKECAISLLNSHKVKKVSKSEYVVKSQAGKGVYVVTKTDDKFTCTCPDHILHHTECKHILAVKYSIAEAEVKLEHKKTDRDWSAYNLGQMKEGEYFDTLLKELSLTVEQPEQTGKGRRSNLFSDKVFCAVKKVSSMKSLRRNQATFNEAETDGMIEKSVHYNTISYFLRNPSLTPILHQLVRLSASPLAEIETSFSIDSSGFRTTQFNTWNGEKWGEKRSHKFLKCHIASGNLSNIITDVIVTEQEGAGTGDVNNFAPLLQNTTGFFNVKEICADGAYLSRENFAMAEELDVEPFIYFKKNTNGKAKGCPAWTNAFIKFMTQHDEFMKHYGKRNNVESTFGALKAKCGEVLKSKETTSQINELLCKVIAYNLTVLVSAMYTHDIEVKF